jgi:hypothetical protein
MHAIQFNLISEEFAFIISKRDFYHIIVANVEKLHSHLKIYQNLFLFNLNKLQHEKPAYSLRWLELSQILKKKLITKINSNEFKI